MPHCILELKMVTEPWQEDRLANIFRCSERMYNIMVTHSRSCLYELNNDQEYLTLLSDYLDCRDGKRPDLKVNDLKNGLKAKRLEHGLSEYDYHAYIAKMKKESFGDVLDIHTAQKLASRAWLATERVLFGNGQEVRYKKRGELDSIEGKSNTSGIKFSTAKMCVKFKKMEIPVKIRKSDWYAYELLEKKICYCRIVRKPFKTGYKYFVQLVLEAIPPKVPVLGTGNVGIDMGTSTVAAIGDNGGLLVAHGNNMDKENNQTVDKYNKEIMRLSKKLERQRRLNNPENYKEDGTVKPKEERKPWKRTKGYYKTLFWLKDAYRRKAEFTEQEHNKVVKQVLALGDTFYTEEMDWVALARRSKKTELSDSTKTVENKDGTTSTVRKFKKKKRFGKSLGNRSPGKFEAILKRKLDYLGKTLNYVNTSTYKASQYNPETETYEKCSLGTRLKPMFDQLIQRDLLSAFLLQNPLNDLQNIDISTVRTKINNFITIHNNVLKDVQNTPNLPSCMGVK